MHISRIENSVNLIQNIGNKATIRTRPNHMRCNRRLPPYQEFLTSRLGRFRYVFFAWVIAEYDNAIRLTGSKIDFTEQLGTSLYHGQTKG